MKRRRISEFVSVLHLQEILRYAQNDNCEIRANNRLEIVANTLESVNNTFATKLFLLQEDIKELSETIKKANDKNDKLQKWFLKLTILGLLLAATQLIQVIDVITRGIGR